MIIYSLRKCILYILSILCDTIDSDTLWAQLVGGPEKEQLNIPKEHLRTVEEIETVT